MINADGTKGMDRSVKKIRQNLKINQTLSIKEKWDEELKDIMICTEYDSIYEDVVSLEVEDLSELVQKYLQVTYKVRVKIQCRDGEIRITRV